MKMTKAQARKRLFECMMKLSKLYDGNLKTTFNVRHSKEDVLIEYIIQQHVVK